MNKTKDAWPELNYERWADCCQTLHRWLQIVGKVRLAKSPWINHSWQTPLYLTARGLTTSLIHGGPQDAPGAFSIDFNFVDHRVELQHTNGSRTVLPLIAESVASFYQKLTGRLRELAITPDIDQRPNELPDRTPFAEDETRRSYDPEFSHRLWQAMVSIEKVMQMFRSKFIGKVSPIHLFWGSFDLAVTRFSGRRAPEHPGGVPNLPDVVAREAYSHEVSSCGFWPGDARYPNPAFYSYAYPMPEGFSRAKIMPVEAFYHETLREFVLPYDVVRQAPEPEQVLESFFETTYNAAAKLGHWDRDLLESSRYLSLLQAQRRRSPVS